MVASVMASAALACPGRALASRQLVGAPYPLSVGLAGGAVWVASVDNGYVWGIHRNLLIHVH
jgi:hypothetical protein